MLGGRYDAGVGVDEGVNLLLEAAQAGHGLPLAAGEGSGSPQEAAPPPQAEALVTVPGLRDPAPRAGTGKDLALTTSSSTGQIQLLSAWAPGLMCTRVLPCRASFSTQRKPGTSQCPVAIG